jgi:exopolysaccharide biosynthesis protein
MKRFEIISLFILLLTPILALALPNNSCSDIASSVDTNGAVVWHKITCPNLYSQKLEINVLDIDATHPKIKFIPMSASDNQLATIPAIAGQNPLVLAGVNGGYFYNADNNPQYHDPICSTKTYPQTDGLGDSLLQIAGKLISSNCDHHADGRDHFSRSVFAIDEKMNFYIQPVSPNLALRNLNDPAQKNVAYAIGAGPNLISTGFDGKGFINITDEGFYHVDIRAARTAVGITQNKHIVLFTVDGKSGVSGMTLRELAEFMLNDLQVNAAMNLDGGGSTTMCIKPHRGKANDCEMVNQPSDASGPRKVYDGLFVVIEDK